MNCKVVFSFSYIASNSAVSLKTGSREKVLACLSKIHKFIEFFCDCKLIKMKASVSTYLFCHSSGLVGSQLWARPFPNLHWQSPHWSCTVVRETYWPGRGWSAELAWLIGGLLESTAARSCHSPRGRGQTTTVLSCHWLGLVWQTVGWGGLELHVIKTKIHNHIKCRTLSCSLFIDLHLYLPVRPNTETLLVSSPLYVMTSLRYSLPGISPGNMWLVWSALSIWDPRMAPETSYNST